MEWVNFSVYIVFIFAFWLLTIISSVLKRSKAAKFITDLSFIGGISVLLLFIVKLWIGLNRPPFRTLGETRLWYSFFLAAIGFILFKRWKYVWLLIYSLFMAYLFLLINYIKPEVYDKTLMPALQSAWFVPHVIVYIFAYSLLAAASIVAIKALLLKTDRTENLNLADNIVYIAFSFLTFGLLFGALWAKDAWGHYWTWDPKETWAFISWLGYLLYIHYRYFNPKKEKFSLKILSLSFLILLIAWFGINYLPSAQNSVHIYS